MAFLLILLFLVAPIAEIYVLITAGQMFGALPVIGACVATAIIGGFLLRLQGIKALGKAQNSIHEGKVPVESVIDAVLLLVSVPFLMTPGFLTDIVGFALLVPPVRMMIGRYSLRRLKRRIDKGTAQVHIHRAGPFE